MRHHPIPKTGAPSAPPAQATAAGFTTRLFLDDFLTASTITASRAGTGFNWWPGPNGTPTYTIAGSELRMSSDPTTNSGGLQSILNAGGSPGPNVFRHGYFEARMKFSPTGWSGTGGWPAFWSLSATWPGETTFTELDFMEGIPTPRTAGSPAVVYDTIHEWTTNFASESKNNEAGGGNVPAIPGGTNFGVYHNYGCLWTPNVITWYFDETPYLTVSIASGGGYSLESSGDSLYLVIGTGPNWLCTWDWVQVWGVVAQIGSVTLSNNTFVGGQAGPVVVGTITVNMTAGSFTGGMLSLTGANAASFQIVGTSQYTLEANGGVAPGSYAINIVATLAGAIGSPFTQPEALTGTGVESPAGTAVTTVGPTINASPTPGTAGSGNIFSITAGAQIAIGQPPVVLGGANVIELYYDSDHNCWQENNVPQWYGPLTASSTGANPVADPRPGFTIAAIASQTVGVAFPVSGTITGYPVTAPTMQYRDDAGAWLALPGGAIVTAGSPGVAGSYSFTHPSDGAVASHTTSVRDANATSVTATSNTYSVAAASTNKVFWGSTTSLHGAPGVATQNTAIAATGQTIRWIEMYWQSGWAGGFDTNIIPGASPADANISPANGGLPVVAISPVQSGSMAQTFTDIIAGTEDAAINNLFTTFKNAGYATMAIRPLWEFDFNQTSLISQYQSAFAHIAALAYAFVGMKIYTIFNPLPNGGVANWYPGDTVVDWIGIDESAGWGFQGNYTSPLDLTVADYQIGGCCTFAVQRGKPVAVCEGGVANSGQNNSVAALGDGSGGNYFNATTTLNGTITAAQTSINVTSTGTPNSFPGTNGFVVGIGGEWLHVTGGAGTTTWTVARGYQGTTAASHNSGSAVTTGGYVTWLSSCLSALSSTGAKMILFGFYNVTDDLNTNGSIADERWNTVAADTAAVVNFINLCPVWAGNLSTTGH